MAEKTIYVGLCRGRYEIPYVNGNYIFDKIDDPTDLEEIHKGVVEWLRKNVTIQIGNAIPINGYEDCQCFVSDTKINLFVTGLSQALAEVIAACAANGVPLILWHFNKDTGDYYHHRMF